MRVFGLTPDQVLARQPAPDAAHTPTLGFSLLYGAVSFGLVATLAYSPWAFGLLRENRELYALIAALFLLSGPVLSRLVIGAGAMPRFSLLFTVAFLAYALVWCVCWFGLGGKNRGDLWGSIAGLAAITFLFCRAFEKRDRFLLLFLALLALHSAGYYLGDYLHDSIRDASNRRTSTGRLLWGAAHGTGFGAGLGFVLYHVQSALRLRLRPANPPSH